MNQEERLITRLKEAGWAIACAESLTGGLFGATLTRPPGASDAFRGGIISYVDPLKTTLLGVDADLLATRGAVDPDVAVQMAQGARERLGADLGVSLTGFAGPGAPGDQPVGRVFIGIATAANARAHEFTFEGGREDVRQQAVHAALRLAQEAVDARASGERLKQGP